MKHVQVIDAALNCSYSICAVEDDDFDLIFPTPGQDVEFVEDVAARLGERRTGQLVLRSTTRRVEKATLSGLHGTLFFGLTNKRNYYPNKRETDLDAPVRAR